MSLAGIYISARELQALAGLSDLQFRLYIVMRRFMDFGSGIVGQKRGVSWQSFREELYQEPGPGVRGGSPDRSATRRAADGLERAGLIKFSDFNEKRKQLIFKCLLADTDKTARNKADRPSTHHPDTAEANSGAVSSPQADTPKKAEADTPPSIREIYTSNPPPPYISPVVGAVAVEFAKIIKPENRAAIAAQLHQVKPEDRQPMVDDLMGFMSNKSSRNNPVKNPSGVIRRMLERYKAGEYIAELQSVGKALRDFETMPTINPQQQKAQPAKPRSKPPANLSGFLKGLRHGNKTESDIENLASSEFQTMKGVKVERADRKAVSAG